MQKSAALSNIKVGIKGGGDIASGVAWRLHACGFSVFITEIAQPLAVRRKVSFCEAVYEGRAWVEGVEAVLVQSPKDLSGLWAQRKIPVLVDPKCSAGESVKADAIVDAIMAKRNLGTTLKDAPLIIALGPGFEAGREAHFVVETQRGHNLGRLLAFGSAAPDTGVPGQVLGIASDRVLRAPVGGTWHTKKDIGNVVTEGEEVGLVEGVPARALINGVLRGLIRSGIHVTKGLKIGDIDPRGERAYCFSISEKALAIGGGVLEGLLRFYGN
jgi:xanthine dehydrogenase accessory factor